MRAWTLTLAVTLSLGAGSAAAQAPPAQNAGEPDGAALYRQNCKSCHGARGSAPERMRSVYPTLKSLADSSYLEHVSADSIAGVLRHGKGKDMKSFADRLSPAEIEAVAKYVKTFGSPAPSSP